MTRLRRLLLFYTACASVAVVQAQFQDCQITLLDQFLPDGSICVDTSSPGYLSLRLVATGCDSFDPQLLDPNGELYGCSNVQSDVSGLIQTSVCNTGLGLLNSQVVDGEYILGAYQGNDYVVIPFKIAAQIGSCSGPVDLPSTTSTTTSTPTVSLTTTESLSSTTTPSETSSSTSTVSSQLSDSAAYTTIYTYIDVTMSNCDSATLSNPITSASQDRAGWSDWAGWQQWSTTATISSTSSIATAITLPSSTTTQSDSEPPSSTLPTSTTNNDESPVQTLTLTATESRTITVASTAAFEGINTLSAENSLYPSTQSNSPNLSVTQKTSTSSSAAAATEAPASASSSSPSLSLSSFSFSSPSALINDISPTQTQSQTVRLTSILKDTLSTAISMSTSTNVITSIPIPTLTPTPTSTPTPSTWEVQNSASDTALALPGPTTSMVYTGSATACTSKYSFFIYLFFFALISAHCTA